MDQMMAALIRRLPLGGINLGGVHSHGPVDGSVVERRTFVASTTVGLGGMAQWGLGGRRMTMNMRREVALFWRRSGVDGRSGKFDAWINILKMSSGKMETMTLLDVRQRSGSAGPIGAPGSLFGDLARPPSFL
jgi:hypothetical protein